MKKLIRTAFLPALAMALLLVLSGMALSATGEGSEAAVLRHSSYPLASTSTPTPTATPYRVYLPLVLKRFDPAHPPTPTPTRTPTRTPTATPTATPTPTNQPPTASVTAPAEGAEFVEGTPIAFQGQATDPEDGPLTGDALVWTSDRDGQIGVGTSFTMTLSAGDHTITLTATDSGGLTGTASVHIHGFTAGITGGEKPVVPVYRPPLDDPVGLAINAAETVAYVVEKGAGRLVAVDIDPASPTYRTITPIASGLEDLQMGLALDPTETYAYVVENEPGKLKRVTLASGQVVTITTGLQYPHDVALSLDGTQAYVTQDSGELVRVNVASGQISTVTAGLWHPTGIAILPSGTEALVNDGGDWLHRVNLTTGATTGFETGAKMPLALALDSTGSKAFITDFNLPHLFRVDVATSQTEHQARSAFRTWDIVISASNTQAYVLWRWLGQIAVMDLDTWEATPVFDALLNPSGVALNASETHAYVLEQQTGELSRIGLDSAAPDYGRPVRMASIGAGDASGTLALSADETWALVVHEGDDEPNLLRVDLTTGLTSTVTSFPLGKLRGVALSPDEQFAYVTGDTVQRVDLATGDVTQVGAPYVYQQRLNGAAITADGRILYVAQRDLHRLLGVDVTTGEVVTVTSNLHLPVAVALAPGETTAWVLEEGRGGALTQVDLASGEQLAVMRLQWWITSYDGMDRFATGRTGNLAVTADGTTAYVALVSPGPRYLYRVDLTGRSNVRLLYQPPMLDVQDVALNEAETRAYLLDRASYTLFQLDMDPTSPTSGTLSALVDGRIAQGRQVALSSDEATLVVAYEEGLMQIRASDGVILKSQWIGPFFINGLALHPAQSIAYVTANDGSLWAVDLNAEEGSTVIASGLDDPTGVVLNGAGTVAYLVERDAVRLVKVTLSTGAVDTVATGLLPSRDVALDEVSGVAYVLGDDVEDNPRVAKVDLATGAVEWALSGAYGGAATAAIVLSQDRQHLYVARNLTGALWRVNLAESAAAAIPPSTGFHPVGYHPAPVYEEMEKQQGAALSPDGQRLYLGNEYTPRLLSLDLDTGRVRLVTGMDWPLFSVAVTPDEHMLYANWGYHPEGRLIEVSVETGETHIVYAGNVSSLALDPTDANFAYVTHLGGVSRLDLTTGARTPLPVQFEPDFAEPMWLVAVNSAGTHLYLVTWVGELGDHAVVRFDLTTNETTTVAVVNSQGDWPATMIVDEAEQYAYVSEQGFGMWGGTRGGVVRRVDIDPTSPTYGQVELVVPDVGEVFPLALDPTGSRLIVGGGCTNVIFEVD